MRRALVLPAILLGLLLPGPLPAQGAPFDLTGPGLRVTVTRAGETLPIAEAPDLSPGDRLSIGAVLPEDQSAPYLLVAGFLRGATNPPPESWFFRAKTWDRKRSVLEVEVPEGAQQLLVFLVPRTGGDFDAVVDAVRGQPGAFVRAAQDLNQASLDRARLDAFVAAVREQDRSRPEDLDAVSRVLTRSLAIKLTEECLNRAVQLQAACLTEGRDTLVLADSHSSSLSTALAGATAGLALQLSATPEAGSGYYSPYIAVVRDLARLFGTFQTTRFSYLPALVRFERYELRLLLNSAPSFTEPRSVLVAALPGIQPPEPPPLRSAAPDAAFCATDPELVLPVEGGPLIYATRYAHDMKVRLQKLDGSAVELPVSADPAKGGYVLGTGGLQLAEFGREITATLGGRWGFAPLAGPRFRLQNPLGAEWRVAGAGPASVVTGRDNSLELEGAAAACVESVSLEQPAGAARSVEWKPTGPDRLNVKLPLAGARPGPTVISIRQRGLPEPRRVTVAALAEAARIDRFTFHAGDRSGVLTGRRLDRVTAVALDTLTFRAGELSRAGSVDRLELIADDPDGAAALAAGEERAGTVALADGRKLGVKLVVSPPRPAVELIGKTVARPPSTEPISISVPDGEAVPEDARLTFSVRARGATRFTGRETIEVATADGRASTSLTASSGLTLQSTEVAVATLEPGRALGSSAFGPLRFRVIQDDVAGDWTPLGTLVRLPTLHALECPDAGEQCTVTGSDLFLVDAVAGNSAFLNPVTVPEGFTASLLTVPKPADGQMRLRLRDDPNVIAVAKIG